MVAMNDQCFIADVMLGKLTKWLRVMGIDVVYDASVTDDQLLRRAEQERRILLTRDRRLAQRRAPIRRLLVVSDYYHEQVRQVVRTFGLEPAIRVFTRCLRCNTRLYPVTKGAMAGRVPSYVYATQMTFKRCVACDRIYWAGTHRDNMLRQLQAMLGEMPSLSAQLSG
jgi:uncharacterized protein with PIN domain